MLKERKELERKNPVLESCRIVYILFIPVHNHDLCTTFIMLQDYFDELY